MASSEETKCSIIRNQDLVNTASTKQMWLTVENNFEDIPDKNGNHNGAAQQTPMNRSDKQQEQQRSRPNAFLAFRVTNEQISDHATRIQQEIIQSNSLLSEGIIPVSTLHITLMVFELKNDEDKRRAQQSLTSACRLIGMGQLMPPQIAFTGLSTFDDKVLFMNPVPDAQFDILKQIFNICQETFEKNGIMSADDHPFHPHLTLFRLNRNLEQQGVTKINSSLYARFVDQHFGTETMRSLQLCQMGKKQADKYYEIIFEKSPLMASDINGATYNSSRPSTPLAIETSPRLRTRLQELKIRLAALRKFDDPAQSQLNSKWYTLFMQRLSDNEKLINDRERLLKDIEKVGLSLERIAFMRDGDPSRNYERLSLAFKDWQQYDEFKKELITLIDTLIVNGEPVSARVEIIGTAIRFYSTHVLKNPLGHHFDYHTPNKLSDVDIQLHSPELVEHMLMGTPELNSYKRIFKDDVEMGTGFHVEFPMVRNFCKRWSNILCRDVDFKLVADLTPVDELPRYNRGPIEVYFKEISCRRNSESDQNVAPT